MDKTVLDCLLVYSMPILILNYIWNRNYRNSLFSLDKYFRAQIFLHETRLKKEQITVDEVCMYLKVIISNVFVECKADLTSALESYTSSYVHVVQM